MNELLAFAAHNSVVALVFALLVCGISRVWRSPPVVHLLWLLVLLKLVIPPVLRIELPALVPRSSIPARAGMPATVLRFGKPAMASGARFVPLPPTRLPAPAASPGLKPHAPGVRLRPLWERGRPFVLWLWLGGVAACALVVAIRIARFERLLRGTLPASERFERLVLEVAGKLGVARAPDVRYVESVEAPLVWWAGRRPTIVLPLRLVSRLDDRRLTLILAHELAHLRRRDHWVRVVELVVATIYWWNPLVWFVRRQLHQAEELCCDAWVRWSFPDCSRRYAEVLLTTAESFGASRVGRRLLPASPFLRSLSLKARIEMILENRFVPYISGKSMIVVALIALLVLPSFVPTTKSLAWDGPRDEAVSKPDGKSGSTPAVELPYAVRFEQGATHFSNGDKITIVEVRGTADTFTAGHIYSIKGTYTLASRGRAVLYAGITTNDADNTSGATLKVQSTVVDRGNGSFTLLLPMPHRGFPHVSFYPAEGGDGFGGNYFGTGDDVLKQWWNTTEAPCHTAFLAERFRHRVAFEIGRKETKDGGSIEIREVWGTRPQIEVGGQYLVRGKYKLPPGQRGKLYFYATASGAWGQTASLDLQSTEVGEGEGEFVLVHGMAGPGYFHLLLTDTENYSRWFANVYFGSGDNVYR